MRVADGRMNAIRRIEIETHAALRRLGVIQQPPRQRRHDLAFQHALQRPGAVARVETLRGQVFDQPLHSTYRNALPANSI